MSRKADDPEGLSILRHCIDIGVNFFDSSEAYGWGGSETVLGKAMPEGETRWSSAPRQRPWMDPNRKGWSLLVTFCSVKRRGASSAWGRIILIYTCCIHLMSGRRGKMRILLRLRSPTAEHMEQLADSLDELVKAGKIRYWGVSNHLARQVAELVELGKREGRVPSPGWRTITMWWRPIEGTLWFRSCFL